MKKYLSLLTLVSLFPLAGCSSPLDFGKKWPIFWGQFKSQPVEENKIFITVRFTKSIDEACSIFQKATIKSNLKSSEFTKVTNRISLNRHEYSSSEEYTDAIVRNTKYIRLIPAENRRIATAVEVLRQSGHKDWKLYSRYHSKGVGDLLREKRRKDEDWDVTKEKYINKAQYKAAKICETFGHEIPFSYAP